MEHKYVLKNYFGAARNYQIDYQKELTAEQLPIVTAPGGPMLVIAGAGSGKTRTITYRVAYLVESGIPLDRIMLVTFTNKAAREMVARAESLLKTDIRDLCGGTFHHVGNMLLRRHAKLIGYESNFTILDRADAKDLIDNCVADCGIDTKAKRFPKGDNLAGLFGLAVNTGRQIADVIAYNYAQFEPQTEEIESVYKTYNQHKRKSNLMDFDDLLFNWWKLLAEHEDVAKRYSGKFLHLLVDEYQDTNHLQAKIMDIMAREHRNIMVVGDDSQSIYSFRGAHFKNIINFPKVYPDAAVYKLEVNHRSTPEILMIANASISLAKEKFDKRLKANRPAGQKPVVVPLVNVFSQASFIAQRMLELRDEGNSLNEMAVLYRSHYQSMEIQMELTKRGIPFEVRSGIRFFEEAHIKDVLAFLKIFHNPKDEISWTRILKLLPKVGPRTAEKVFNHISQTIDAVAAITADEAVSLVPAAAQRDFRIFQQTLRDLQDKIDSPAEMIKIIASSNYAEYIKGQYANFRERLEDLEQMGSYATQFKSLEDLLSSLALVSGIESETIVDGGEVEKEACVLSSVHQAKGLEWRIVFVVWLADGRFPSYLSFNKEEEMEEERRLFYVAVTRAKDELYLTYPLVYSGYEGEVLLKESRFLEEIPENYYEKWTVEEEKKSSWPGSGWEEKNETEQIIDLSDYREVKVQKDKRDNFEAIDINELMGG
ncbi:MAG: ATP-dependent helicase [Candidatus Margulisiibacteriota bacterium]